MVSLVYLHCRPHPVHDGDSIIYFRGKRLLRAALEDLSSKGMKSATGVILTGCSGMLCVQLHTCL